jgi:hypothetical protein
MANITQPVSTKQTFYQAGRNALKMLTGLRLVPIIMAPLRSFGSVAKLAVANVTDTVAQLPTWDRKNSKISPSAAGEA